MNIPEATSMTRAGDCLAGGAAMGSLMRSLDWAGTLVGPIETWPQSLRTAISIILDSRFPMYIAWGPRFVQFYNDGYRPILGSTKHPAAMGLPASETFAESWHVIGPMFEDVRKGIACGSDDWMLPLDRHGYLEECFFTFSYSPIRDESGGVGGVLVTVTETTTRVLGERRLRTLRDLAERAAEAKDEESAWARTSEVLAQNSADIPFALMYRSDSDGPIARLNNSVGISADRCAGLETIPISDHIETLQDVGRRFGDLTGASWPEAVREALLIPIARPGLDRPYGVLIAGVSPRRALDDAYRDFLSLVAGHVGTAVGNARALEEEHKRLQALAELDRAKTTFFSNVSHEFRTPITLMLGPVEEMLARREAGDERIREDLEMVRRNGLRLLRLVNTILDFLQIEAGAVRVHLEPTDLAHFTADLASVFRSATEKAGLKLIVDCPPLSNSVLVDREMWEKIVLNLLSNAFKFTFEGSINVRLRETASQVELTVGDTGTGIPAEQLSQLFQRFHRVEGAKGRSYEGTGIGLAFVQELATLQGGTARAESQVGKGSEFTVTLPLRAAAGPGATEAAPNKSRVDAYSSEASRWVGEKIQEPDHAHPQAVAGERIFVVDDNADMRDYVSRLLSAHYHVETFSDGEAALAAASVAPPDIILSDVMMSRVEGFELVRSLRADPKTSEIPIILISARAGEEARIQGMQAGADDYIVKPFTARELMARVSSHLNLGRVRKQASEALRKSESFNRSVIESSRDGINVLTLDGELLSMNRQGQLALEISDLDTVLHKSWPASWNEKYRGAAEKAVHDAAAGGVGSFEALQTTASGVPKWWDVLVNPILDESGKPKQLLAASRDITVRKHLEEQLLLLVRASSTILTAPNTKDVLQTVVELAQQFIAADGYAMWRRAPQENTWEIVSSSGLSENFSGKTSQEGPVTLSAEAIEFEDVRASKLLVHRQKDYDAEGIRSMLTVPLRLHGEFSATLVFYFRKLHRFTKGERTIATALGNLAAAAVTSAELYERQHELRRQAEEAQSQAMVLARAGAILASSLDVNQTLSSIVELAVPSIADWCAVDLVESAGVARRVSVKHIDPAKVALAHELQRRFPPDPESAFWKVIQTGQSLLVPEITDELLAAGAQSAEHLAAVRELGLRSCVLAPLVVNGESLGVLTLVTAESGRHYREADRQFVNELAQRAAFAVNSARLHSAATQSLARLQVAALAADLGIYEWNMKTRVATWENERAYQIFGRSREEGPPSEKEFFEEIILPADADAFRTALTRAMESDGHFYVTTRIYRKDGSVRWVEALGRYDFLGDGTPHRMIGVMADITDRKHAADQMRESEERLRFSLKSGRMASWELDLETRLFERTLEHDAIFGATKLFPRWSFTDLLEQIELDDREMVDRRFKQALTSGEDWDFEARIQNSAGETRWIWMRGRHYVTPDRPARIIGVISDITERKRIEDRLREAAKLESLGILAGGVAHDFNNLLVGILGSASCALDMVEPHSEVRPLLETLVGASERAATLTRQMLAYSGRGKFVISRINLHAMVSEIMSLVRTTIPRSAELKLEPAGKLPVIEGDSAQIQQLVMNLSINAAEALLDQPGRVTVSIRELWLDADSIANLNSAFSIGPGKYLCLEVTDTGCGMDPKTLSQIFDPFFTTKFTGRGLGLSAVLGIVRGHRGALKVYSEPNRGTTFKVFLPTAEHEAERETPAPQILRGTGTVLVVDDEEVVRSVARKILASAGYTVVEAVNGAEAIATLRNDPDGIDLVLLDMSMPVMGGEETLPILLSIRPNLPVILSTGFAEAEASARFAGLGLAGYLQKPYTAKRFKEKLSQIGLSAGVNTRSLTPS